MEHVNTQKYRQDRSVVAGTNTPERGRRESKVVSVKANSNACLLVADPLKLDP